MKKILALFFLAAIVAVGCNEESIDPVDDPLDNTPTIPSKFTKKVFIEEFTGEWCGACPAGQRSIQSAIAANPARVLAMGIHIASPNDRYENTDNRNLYSHLTNTLRHPGMSSIGFPSIMPDRMPGSNGQVINGHGGSTLGAAVTSRLAEEAICGLKLESSISGDAMDVNVSYSFKSSPTGPVAIMVAVLENNLDGSLQVSGGSGYMHQHVLRKLLTPTQGANIDGNTTGTIETIEFKGIDMSAYNNTDVEVVAYIVENGGSYDKYRILNAQGVHAGDTQDFD